MKTKSRNTFVAIAATAAIASGAFVAPASAQSIYDGKSIFTQGHADVLYATVADGKAELKIHDDTTSPASYGVGEDYVFHVIPSAPNITRTANAFVAQIPGFTQVGQEIYVLPQNNVAGTIFAGFGHNLPNGTQVTYNLTDYEGPGNFATWQAGEEGPTTFWNSTQLPSSFTSPANHEHLAWGFSAQGEYQLTIDIDVALPTGETYESDDVVYTFYVGEELPEAETPVEPEQPQEINLEISGLKAHYHAGGIVSLNAQPSPETNLDHYHWFTRVAGGEWEVVPGAASANYSFIATEGDNGLEIQARLYAADHSVAAQTEPVVILVDDHGNPPVEGPWISATLNEVTGSLVVSVSEENKEVELSDFALNAEADRYVANGEVKGIKVTDTRSENPGWTLNGRVRGFTTTDGESLSGANLGWSPKVLANSANQQITAGEAVSSTLSGGAGVAAWTQLASATAGAGIGQAEIGADLILEAPLDLTPGTYGGLLILTTI